MNIILFEPEEDMSFLVSGDLREVHLRGVIRVKTGDYFYAGILNGPMGKALVTDISDKGITFNLELNMVSPPLYPVTLLLGMPRPIMAKRILREAAALGVGGIRFFKAEKGQTKVEVDFGKSRVACGQ